MKQTHNHPTPLTVYKASAGSGKTFTLAVEYISLLVTNPESYKNILAVTFTNKATEEMKMRILSQLYGLAQIPVLKESEDYLEKIRLKTGLEETIIQDHARKALHYLINDYTYFHVETIDSFFQRVLRNLARELELTPNLRLELNDGDVESMAIDQMLESLKRDDAIFTSIMHYIYENMDNDKSWNIIHQMKKFGLQIFSDLYKEKSGKFNDKILTKEDHELPDAEREKKWNEYFENFDKLLRGKIEAATQYVKKRGEGYFNLLSNFEIDLNDIKLGATRGVNLYFKKLKEGAYTNDVLGKAVQDCMDSADNWVTKTNKNASHVIDTARTHLLPYLVETEKNRNKLAFGAHSAELTRRHLHDLKLLTYVEREVRRLNDNANRFLLSDTQHLLKLFIKGSDAPFIYEKIGSQLNHIMIDEFQDTSELQWSNFKVLLEDCMDRNSQEPTHSLIVGDVKQSIYRWRNGDWRLLNDIRNQLGHRKNLILEEPLDTNYRSCGHVITFNNSFFREVVNEEVKLLETVVGEQSKQLDKAYDDVEQKLNPNKSELSDKGYVRIVLLKDQKGKKEEKGKSDQSNKSGLSGSDYILKNIGEQMQTLISIGAKQSDMAILIRKNDDTPIIAEWFMKNMPEIQIVSDQAFRLESSLAVNTIILALRYLYENTDLLSLAMLTNTWNQHILKNGYPPSELFCSPTDFSTNLPKDFMEKKDDLLSLPLITLLERICEIFHLFELEGEAPYLCTFFDLVSKFMTENNNGIGSLLELWDESLCKKSVQSETVNGVRLVSIHKSKGLEFEHVFIPFCDWRIEHPNETIWCEPKQFPYNQLPIVPINYSSQLIGSIYEPDYQEEYLQTMVDNLNLLYVAFTRAKSSLFVYARGAQKGYRGAVIASVLDKLQRYEQMTDSKFTNLQNDSDAKEMMIFEYGSLYVKSEKTNKEQSRNVFLQQEKPIKIQMRSHKQQVNFLQSNDSQRYIVNDEETEERIRQYILRGNIVHNILSKIKTTDDIPQVLQELENDGVIYSEEISHEELTRMIRRNLEHPVAREWFNGKWKLFTECNILQIEDGVVKQHRPDRVMTDGQQTIVVDYKTGRDKESTREKYVNQVKRYVRLLEEMGMPNVKGYLWYLGDNIILDTQNQTIV